jgi:hypothetical protein
MGLEKTIAALRDFTGAFLDTHPRGEPFDLTGGLKNLIPPWIHQVQGNVSKGM